jgi:RimJ/RimL family protein N-acetyltransferase
MSSKAGHADELTDNRRWWERLLPVRQSVPVQTAAEPELRGNLVRSGVLVELRKHVPGNRAAFQQWYADHDIARLLRHDLRPLSFVQSMVYFDTVILPSSALGLTCAIHDRASGQLIGTTGLTDIREDIQTTCYFRIVIGESRFWNQGYGSEATRLMLAEGFERQGIDAVNLEVFDYNERAIAAYRRVGFEFVGEHIEWPEPGGPDLHVLEMRLPRERFLAINGVE